MFRLGSSTSAEEGVGRSLAARIDAAAYATMAYWFYRWDWGEAIAIDGLAAIGPEAAGGAARDFAVAAAEGWITDADEGIDPHGPATMVMDLLERGGWQREQAAVHAMAGLAEQVMREGRSGGGITVHPGESTLYVDALYGLPSALVRFGRHQGSKELVGAVGELVLGHCEALQGPDGLFAHFAEAGHRGSAPWGRGMGWAVLGISDLLRDLPSDEGPQVTRLRHHLARAVEALAEHQAPGGEFRNIINQRASYPEASTTAMVAAGVAQAIELGDLNERFRPLARRAWTAVEHRIDTNGHLVGVSYRPGVNEDSRRYEHTPTVGSYPWGQGAYLRAAAVHLKEDSHEPLSTPRNAEVS